MHKHLMSYVMQYLKKLRKSRMRLCSDAKSQLKIKSVKKMRSNLGPIKERKSINVQLHYPLLAFS